MYPSAFLAPLPAFRFLAAGVVGLCVTVPTPTVWAQTQSVDCNKYVGQMIIGEWKTGRSASVPLESVVPDTDGCRISGLHISGPNDRGVPGGTTPFKDGKITSEEISFSMGSSRRVKFVFKKDDCLAGEWKDNSTGEVVPGKGCFKIVPLR